MMNWSRSTILVTACALVIAGAYAVSSGSFFLFSDLLLTRPVEGKIETVSYPKRNLPEKKSNQELKVAAAAGGIYNLNDRGLLWGLRTESQRPIASLTKLMSALVFIDHNPGWQNRIVISSADHRAGARQNLFPGDSVTVRELFRTALVASDNSAVAALVRVSGLSEKEFVKEMNFKAEALHLRDTRFVDPTGLEDGNVSTPGNIARLAAVALANPDIRDATPRSAYDFTTGEGRKKHIVATDKLLNRDLPAGVSFVGGKTGHLDAAGYCFVGLFEKDGHRIATVVLGTDTDEARFAETEKMVEWAYTNFSWKPVLGY